MPVYAVPIQRYTYAPSTGFSNDEIEYWVTGPNTVGQESTALVKISALSSDKLKSLTALQVSITLPRSTLGTASFSPPSYSGVLELASRPTSRVWTVADLALGDQLTFSVPFTPQSAGEFRVGYTVAAVQLNKRLELALPVTISPEGGAS